MDENQMSTGQADHFLFLPAVSGGGVLIRKSQIVGARPNGPDQGAILYTEAGPSIYTTLMTKDLAELLDAQKVAANR